MDKKRVNYQNYETGTWRAEDPIYYKKRSKPKIKLKETGMLLFFMLAFPYICVLFIHGMQNQSNETEYVSDVTVTINNEKGIETVPLEEYVIGCIPSSIALTSETETIKAQAVILRTEAVKNNQQDIQSSGQEYISVSEMQTIWGSDFSKNYDKIKDLVEQTEGIIMTYEKEPIEAPFFYLSAGKTRKGEEVLQSSEYPYLQSANCEQDIMHEEYRKVYTFYKEDFFTKANETMEIPIQEANTIKIIKKDFADYVVQIELNGQVVSGEEFRKAYLLNSAHFDLKEDGSKITITTQGIGHGLGFCQNTADLRAKEGEDFIKLLKYFYKNIEIEKK